MIAAAIANGYSVVTASPQSSPASATRASRAGPSRSPQSSTNAAKAISDARTWPNSWTANGITSVPIPSVSAVAVPSPGRRRSATRRTSSRSSSAGSTVPNRPSAQISGAWISSRRFITAARVAE